MSDLVLEVRDLRTRFQLQGGAVEVVRGVDLYVAPAEVLGLIGESGSGKTVTGLSILRLLPGNAAVSSAAMRFKGRELQDLDEDAFQPLRGLSLAMIFQNPVGAFNPAKRVDWHLREIARRRHGSEKGWQSGARDALSAVGIPHPERVLRLYPHQLSGGMAQRILIAMVLALEPELVIADEPTTNLDNIVERQIVALFRKLRDRLNAAFIFITHDMSIAAALCDRIAVMYAGQIVEVGPTRAVFDAPRHPYTQGLTATSQALKQKVRRLTEIPGELPSLVSPPPGCPFAPRCAKVMARCREEAPPMFGTAPHLARCFLAKPA
ncbi:MAG: ABC transporter ATP-binding protein [Alphaproteobacteria bacterium]|nr:ABC transporter ATP-binding protein [Alphaproteobacteria bacterium]